MPLLWLTDDKLRSSSWYIKLYFFYCILCSFSLIDFTLHVSIEFYTIKQVIPAFWLVLAYDLLDDRYMIDVITAKIGLSFWAVQIIHLSDKGVGRVLLSTFVISGKNTTFNKSAFHSMCYRNFRLLFANSFDPTVNTSPFPPFSDSDENGPYQHSEHLDLRHGCHLFLLPSLGFFKG